MLDIYIVYRYSVILILQLRCVCFLRLPQMLNCLTFLMFDLSPEFDLGLFLGLFSFLSLNFLTNAMFDLSPEFDLGLFLGLFSFLSLNFLTNAVYIHQRATIGP